MMTTHPARRIDRNVRRRRKRRGERTTRRDVIVAAWSS
jgi:hypothetical protein